MPKKICNYSGCHEIISMKETYCYKHKLKHKKDVIEKNKTYDLTVRDKKCSVFYHSKEWSIIRNNIKNRDYGLCMLCLSNNSISSMDLVHHIIPLNQNWSTRLNKDLLISVCSKCHKLIHDKYKKSNKDKLEMQKKLKRLIEQ